MVKCVIFLTLFAGVRCVDEILRAQQPLYGMATMVDALVNATRCFKDLKQFAAAVEDREVWALKILDASGRPPSGFLYGNNFWLGSHSQCVDIANTKPLEVRNDKIPRPRTPHDYPPFPLAFGSVSMVHNSTLQLHTRMPMEWTVHLGLCVPASCSEEDIFDTSQAYFEGRYLEFQRVYEVNMNVTKVRRLKEDVFWLLRLPKTIVFMALMGTIMVLTVAGTVYDVREHNREKNIVRGHNCGVSENGKVLSQAFSSAELVTSSTSTLNLNNQNVWGEILKCFSYYTNVKRFTKTKVGSDSVPVIHGLRFLGMGWVILVHTTFYQADFVANVPYAFRLTENFMAQIFSNSTYAVDTYLFLSGFLLAYLFFKKTNPHATHHHTDYAKKGRQFVMMLSNRFFRLTPTYVLVMMLCDVVHTYYSETSTLTTSEKPEVLCDRFWWRNLLYINNLYPRSEMCLSWSWYLSLDTQFFAIGAFLLLLSTVCFKASAIIVVGLVLTNIVATAYKSYSIGYIPTMDDQLQQLDAIYDLPWNRIGAYLVGIVGAYLLVIRLDGKFVLRERTRLLLWTGFPLINLWILFTLYTRQVSVEFSAFYMGVSRTLWAVGIAWLVVACSTRNARLLEKVLSFKGFVPLSRLTYCSYLLNPLVVNMISLGSEDRIYASIPQFAIGSLGITMITFMMAFLFSMLFESPFILLTKLALNRFTPKVEGPKEETQRC
ncbi:nose resistant to fluoxetine protein 6-like isoform X1 [Cylas formicarius]|uniref:nose resistant to fluoxetine protein 6-like isoform X1 n=1 Tax=Cylas formicarius TaxID=197179 RepID=UPI002958C762|nr:nose resistant to fluoxetine protein 6-like isoform X1 [Cylas formicarius]